MIGQRPSRESIMTALFDTLVSATQTQFTANLTRGDPTLYNPSTTANLMVGLPVMGVGIPPLAVISTVTPALTMSLPAQVNGSNSACIAGVITTGRRLLLWDQVAAQPALFLRDTEEDLQYPGTILQIQTIKAEVFLYAKTGNDPTVVGSTILNNFMDSIQAALAPDDPSTNRFTLGGLVEWCRLEGRVDKEPGDLDGQAMAVAEILITVP
jgi:hypothetical protein